MAQREGRSGAPLVVYHETDEDARRTIRLEPQQGYTYADIRNVARHAEAVGFEAFFRSDHYTAFGRAGDTRSRCREISVHDVPSEGIAWRELDRRGRQAIGRSDRRLRGSPARPATQRQIDDRSGRSVERLKAEGIRNAERTNGPEVPLIKRGDIHRTEARGQDDQGRVR